MSKNIIIKLCAVLAVLGLYACKEEPQNYTVAVTQIVEHPALDAAREGVKDELAEQGFVVGENIEWVFENAQGSIPNTVSIAKKFAGLKPNVIVSIATPSAQAVAGSAKGIPHIFSAITDPVGAGLAVSLAEPGNGTSGVSDLLPIKAHMELVKKVVPNLGTLGVIYNSGEANSITLVRLVKEAAQEMGFSVKEATVAKSTDVLSAAQSLVGKVDAIYVPTDNTVISVFESVVKVAEQAKIPLIAGDTDSAKRGAAAALGFNYYDLGRQTGVMVAKVLRGEDPGTFPVETVQKTELYVNPAAAERMGITLSEELIASAKEVI